MLDWLFGKPKLQLSEEMRRWIDGRWVSLEEMFGAELVREVEVVLPRPEFFPDAYRGTAEDALRLVGRVCHHMRVPTEVIRVFFFDDSDPFHRHPGLGATTQSGAAGLYMAEDGNFSLGIAASQIGRPEALIATVAHELGHVHLLGTGRLSSDAPDHEPLTDLLTVYFGMGILCANSVVQTSSWQQGRRSGWSIGRQGYLSMPAYGYALARFACAREEDGSDWEKELRLDVRSAFRASMELLAAG